jgi:hypothetical protein
MVKTSTILNGESNLLVLVLFERLGGRVFVFVLLWFVLLRGVVRDCDSMNVCMSLLF